MHHFGSWTWMICLESIEFFRNYTKMAMLAIKAYIGISKIKKYLHSGMNQWPVLFYSDAFLTELTLHCMQDWYYKDPYFVMLYWF